MFGVYWILGFAFAAQKPNWEDKELKAVFCAVGNPSVAIRAYISLVFCCLCKSSFN